jgi:uncharacterized phage protein (TIGR02216 family)
VREQFPWARVMQLGLGTLRLHPDAFWRMTLRELVASFAVADAGFERSTLQRLMQEWPDDT